MNPTAASRSRVIASVRLAARPRGLLSREFVFDIIDDLTFNAFALQMEGRDAILFQSRVPLTLFILFCRLLSCRDALPWVGDPRAESETVTPLLRLPDCFADVTAALLATIDTKNTSPGAIEALTAGLAHDKKEDLLRARNRPKELIR